MTKNLKKNNVTYIDSLEKKLEETKALNDQLNEYIENVQLAQMEAIEAQKAADAANKAKSDFLANMSHELRTPMNGVMGMAHLLVETKLNLEQKEYVETINSSAQTLLMLLNDILDFSKIEAGELVLENIAFNLKKAVQNAINLLQPLAEAKEISLISIYDDNVPSYIFGDPERLKQIISNLVSNAIKFTENGSVKVKLTADSNNNIIICVEDTGIGIPKDKIVDVFGKFTQADASVTRKYGGTGLGLAITKQLVELMNGSISVKSEVGKGSEFSLELPYEEAKGDMSGLILEDVVREQNRIDVKDAKILIVEDYPVNQVFAKKLLAKFGFNNIDLAENGFVALDKMKNNSYDAIFMDCQMPELDGFEATKEIRRFEASSKIREKRLIIAMTANAMVGDRELCMDAGMNEYVSKPLNPEKLKNLLSRWFIFENENDFVVKTEENIGSDDDTEAVNLSQLRMFTDGDMEEEKELIDMFFEQADESISNLEESYFKDDNPSWKSAAHKLKGASGNLGAEELHLICLDAEKNFEQGKNEKFTMLNKIKDELERVRRFLFRIHKD